MEIAKERIRWKSGYRANVDAATAWSVYEAVKASTEGKPTAADLLEEAEDESCPIHDAFEWDDSKAGHEYRLSQARSMMRSFVVVPEESSKPREGHRALEIQSVPSGDGTRPKAAYVPVVDVMKDPVARGELLQRALGELVSIRRRFKHLQELASVFAEVEAVLQSVDTE